MGKGTGALLGDPRAPAIVIASGLASRWLRWARYVQRIVDLAYKVHQAQVDGGGAEAEQRIAALREEISRARTRLTHSGG